MKCPIDGAELVMSERHGVEIDYCPKCRGVWLDRGELDKIIEKATGPVPMPEPEPRSYRAAPAPEREDSYRRDRYQERDRFEDRDRRDDRRGHDKKHRRKSILSEIFDFD